MSKPVRKELIDKYIADKKYKCIKKLNSGAFGKVYLGENTQSGEKVAIKLESQKENSKFLQYEYYFYSKLSDGIGIPKVEYYGKEKKNNALVMTLLGPSLESFFSFCGKKFTLHTVCLLADQMIDRIEFIHSKGIIHRDIKPENFLTGLLEESSLIYLVDFGFSDLYRDSVTNEHIECVDNETFYGTMDFSSCNALQNKTQSRRDDIEALGYVLIYFLKGKLPWHNITAETSRQQADKVLEMKLSASINDLCKGIDDIFNVYMSHCRSLDFKETPDYRYLKDIFRFKLANMRIRLTSTFDWIPNVTWFEKGMQKITTDKRRSVRNKKNTQWKKQKFRKKKRNARR
ncbi:casein kinase I-like [Teleopsis dalmanni]|uniref:casein kinase I-like n=1 Tax=Teleopsis dalmanni TaxID=139649 RepID=UPI0018CD2030|nr:casein kinase I-like [Teleopsis dalmanni]XP_037937668.1 casein kinase I-like [Teleopsis dalmanni]XP_037937669.1 casein kinase I-like [Teleopsis dalmanni]XP_037937670.1 casein kinase I-like [Teleopsis dalmanni]XP_037937671.1 casein kinase I-like [Teleopsis dalmanni]